MRTNVYPVEDAEQPITEADVVNVPSTVYVAAEPPGGIVFLIPLPGGKFAKCVVDANELEVCLDTAHERLIEAEADKHEPVTEVDAAAPDEVLPTNAEEQPTE